MTGSARASLGASAGATAAGPSEPAGAAPRPTRRPARRLRRRILLGAAGAAAGTVLLRGRGYREHRGATLSDWEAEVLYAAAEALFGDERGGASLGGVVASVDGYLRSMPAAVLRELGGALLVLEQLAPLPGVSRFTRLPPAARLRLLQGLADGRPLGRQIYAAVRNLCLLGLYAQPGAWPQIGYGGPLVGGQRSRWPDYEALRAPRGSLPRGASR